MELPEILARQSRRIQKNMLYLHLTESSNLLSLFTKVVTFILYNQIKSVLNNPSQLTEDLILVVVIVFLFLLVTLHRV